MPPRPPVRGHATGSDDAFFEWLRSRIQSVRAPESLRAQIEAMLAVERARGS
jgi:hypothetical protein